MVDIFIIFQRSSRSEDFPWTKERPRALQKSEISLDEVAWLLTSLRYVLLKIKSINIEKGSVGSRVTGRTRQELSSSVLDRWALRLVSIWVSRIILSSQVWVENKWLVFPKCDRQNEHSIDTESTLLLLVMHLLLPLVHTTHNITCIFLWTPLGKNIHTSFFVQTCQASEPMHFSLPEVFSSHHSPALLLPADLSSMPPSQRGGLPWPLCQTWVSLVILSPAGWWCVAPWIWPQEEIKCLVIIILLSPPADL